MSNNEIIEAQNNEFEALQAIYVKEDLRDLRKASVWGRWQPLHFALSLTPQQGSITLEDAKVDLHVKCSEKYPFEAPALKVQSERGISQEQSQQLLRELQAKANKLVGDVMIFELAQHVQEFLYKNSKPASKSFYEEMQLREERKQLAQKQKENLEREILVKEVKERQALHKQANKRYRDEHRLSETSTNSNSRIDSFNESSTESSGDLHCEHNKLLIEFSNMQISRGQCIEHLPNNCIQFTGMDIDNGQIFLLSEWTINEITDKQFIQKQISCIEQEFKSLLKLKHSNLIHFINFEHALTNEGKITIHLLNEFVLGSNCHALYLSKGIPVEADMLRIISENVLNALEFLHINNIVHKNLCASCVIICNKGHIKLSNFSIYQRLTDLVTHSNSTNNYSKKTDIFKFGILILSLIMGTCVDEDDISMPNDVGVDLRDFIEKCILKDEYRYSTTQLLQHLFLKHRKLKQSPIKKALNIPDNNLSDTHADDIKFLAQTNLNGKSRVETEFERLDYIGKGAYGQVFKVRNKLDQRVYALKSIILNSKNKLINRKIIREVKLLSGLNHENVVRYYNSWIESATVEISDDSSDDTSKSSPAKTKSKFPSNDTFLQKLVPNFNDFEWSISYGGKSNKNLEAQGDESSSCDDDIDSLFDSDESDSDSQIEFEHDEHAIVSKTSEDGFETDDGKCLTRQIQYMYIQMEFCDKSTLRTAIDNNLYQDKEKLWRLFREIVEGLAHIHQQGMIHRDLKPVNIFLDAFDHVKIGDFGLATSNLLARTHEPVVAIESLSEKSHGAGGDPYSLTGQIGTALYVAPELNTSIKANYNQKVDIYSLGIIFFEMCYKPCSTQSERINILSKLRTANITFPDDADEFITGPQKHILKWLLDHKPINRPTSQELLQSEHIPPPVLEERELRELLRHTLKNPQLKAYKYLVESCLNQPITMVQDISYDKDVGSAFASRNLRIFNHVRELVINVFKLHGGQELSTPLLMPKNKCYEGVDTCVRLMTHSGSVVTIPHDLRVPFARYVAWNGITSLRRYSIARVYREKRAFGFVPRELYECAFDIVTPASGNLMADAEVIYVLDEVASAIPGLRDKNLLIRLNHMSLLKAILLYCGIKDKHSEFYSILADAREGKVTKLQVRTHLISTGVSNNSITTLYKFLNKEAPISQIQNFLQTIIKKKSTDSGILARQALKDLQIIVENAESLGVTKAIVINLGLIYAVPQYSGMICQLASDTKRKHKQTLEILAAGGRYDDMLNNYKSMACANKELSSQSAVGVSISLDRLVQIFANRDEDDDQVTHLDAVVGSFEKNSNTLKYVGRILRELRSVGIKATYVDGASLKEITEQGDELNVHYVIIYKDGQARVHHSRNIEKLQWFSLDELVENFQRMLKSSSETGTELTNTTGALSRMEARMSHGGGQQDSQQANVNIVYLMHGEKISSNAKKRLDYNIKLKMNEAFNKLMGDVTLFAMNVDRGLICDMASCFSFESEEDYYKSVEKLKERNPKYKKYLDEICKKIFIEKTKSSHHTIILFSIEESIYRVFL